MRGTPILQPLPCRQRRFGVFRGKKLVQRDWPRNYDHGMLGKAFGGTESSANETFGHLADMHPSSVYRCFRGGQLSAEMRGTPILQPLPCRQRRFGVFRGEKLVYRGEAARGRGGKEVEKFGS